MIAEDDIEQAVGNADGVWFVFFRREVADYLALGVESHPALNWLEENLQLEDTHDFGELAVYHFVRQPANGDEVSWHAIQQIR